MEKNGRSGEGAAKFREETPRKGERHCGGSRNAALQQYAKAPAAAQASKSGLEQQKHLIFLDIFRGRYRSTMPSWQAFAMVRRNILKIQGLFRRFRGMACPRFTQASLRRNKRFAHGR